MKKFFFGIALLLSVGGASAFPRDTLNSNTYRNFKYLKELWVCSSHAFPVNVSHSVFGVAFTQQTGYYLQVEPNSHKDGSTLPVGGKKFDGVFNISGRPAGAYDFVYINTSSNFCGMTVGEQALVRIYIVPELIGNTILSNVCAGKSFNVNLRDYLPYEVKNFADSADWVVQFYDARTHSPVTTAEASLGKIGTRDFYYKIDDVTGPFAGKFSKIRKGWACADSGVISHTVRIRDSIRLVKDTVPVTFCIDNVRALSEHHDRFTVNLAALLGASVDGGVWSVPSNVPSSFFPRIDVNTGELTFDMVRVATYTNFNFDFTYKFKNCDNSNVTGLVRIVFTDNMSPVISGDTGTICRNLGSGILDLGLFFGFSAPTTAGIWLDMQKGGKEHEILSGSIDLNELNVGSLYHYQYRVHPASVDFCGTGYNPSTGGSHADVWEDYYLKVRDIEILSGSARVCRSSYASGVMLNLYDYVPGLSDPNLVDPDEVSWVDHAGLSISTSEAQNYLLQGQPRDTTLILPFSFTYSNDCGTAPGNLYISVVDSLQTHKLHIKLQLCYTDDQASYVDLRQVIGIAGLQGTFTVESTDPAGKTIVWIDQSKGIFNAYATFADSPQKETYTFKYTPAASELQECLRNDIRVSITVTRHVE
jgi:hypothetical protein